MVYQLVFEDANGYIYTTWEEEDSIADTIQSWNEDGYRHVATIKDKPYRIEESDLPFD